VGLVTVGDQRWQANDARSLALARITVTMGGSSEGLTEKHLSGREKHGLVACDERVR
jgi:hypothetical protein